MADFERRQLEIGWNLCAEALPNVITSAKCSNLTSFLTRITCSIVLKVDFCSYTNNYIFGYFTNIN